MVLSNSAKSIFVCAAIMVLIQGCKWWPRTEVGNSRGFPEPTSEIPFETAEPEVFQCEIVRGIGSNEQRSFFARKSGRWRFDLDPNETVLRSDRYYRFDNGRKIITEIPQGGPMANQPEFLADLTLAALRRDTSAKFEKVGPDGDLVKFNVTMGDRNNARAVIYVDEAKGLVMKEEFFSLNDQGQVSPAPTFVFELRGLKMEVDDSVFAIPSDFKKLSWTEYMTVTGHGK